MGGAPRSGRGVCSEGGTRDGKGRGRRGISRVAAATVASAAGTEVTAASAAWVADRSRSGLAGTRSNGGLYRDLGRQRLRELRGNPLGPGSATPPGPVPDLWRAAPPDSGECASRCSPSPVVARASPQLGPRIVGTLGRPAALCAPVPRRSAPHSCSRFPPSPPRASRSAAGPGRAGVARPPGSALKAEWAMAGERRAAEHMDYVLALLVLGLPEPVAGGGLRPSWPRTSTEIWRGVNLVEVLARPRLRSRPRGRDAGARNCLACGGHRCVQGGNRSPGWEGGKYGPGPDGGRAPGPGRRARGPILELWRRAIYFA